MRSPSGVRWDNSCRILPCAPRGISPISLLAFPPSTGRSWISATRWPSRAAVRAAAQPETPPPTTTTSNCPASTGSAGRPRSALRQARLASPISFGGIAPSALRKIASQRPSNPVRSCSIKVAEPFDSKIFPPEHQDQSGPLAPNSVPNVTPLIESVKRPGA